MSEPRVFTKKEQLAAWVRRLEPHYARDWPSETSVYARRKANELRHRAAEKAGIGRGRKRDVFELWDTRSGNRLGVFRSRRAADAALAEEVANNGRPETLALVKRERGVVQANSPMTPEEKT